MAFQPLAVANEMIEMHGASGGIDHLKLQKLMYFSNGWYLAINGKPMMESPPQVWRYGPVFPTLYNIFSKYGRSAITTPERESLFGGRVLRVDDQFKVYLSSFLDWVWNLYGGMSGSQLSDLTHAPGTPWYNIAIRNGFEVNQNTAISSREDWAYFTGLASQRGIPTKPLQA